MQEQEIDKKLKELNKQLKELDKAKTKLNKQYYEINHQIEEIGHQKCLLYKTDELIKLLNEAVLEKKVYSNDEELSFIQSYYFTKEALYLKGIELYYDYGGRIGFYKNDRWIKLDSETVDHLKEYIKPIKDCNIEFPFDFNTFVIDYVGGIQNDEN